MKKSSHPTNKTPYHNELSRKHLPKIDIADNIPDELEKFWLEEKVMVFDNV